MALFSLAEFFSFLFQSKFLFRISSVKGKMKVFAVLNEMTPCMGKFLDLEISSFIQIWLFSSAPYEELMVVSLG